MKNPERDEFITLYRNKCWHKLLLHDNGYNTVITCEYCSHYIIGTVLKYCPTAHLYDLERPSAFYELFEWSMNQEWWDSFKDSQKLPVKVVTRYMNTLIPEGMVNPTRFADAIGQYLLSLNSWVTYKQGIENLRYWPRIIVW